MPYVNNFVVCGHMTADIQTVQGQNGNTCYFTLAVNRGKDAVDFIPVRVSEKFIAKTRDRFVKGAAVLVTGRVESGSYKDKNGNSRSFFHVSPETIQTGVNGNFNAGILFGNFTADPEMRQTQTGKNVISFSVGSTRRYKDANGEWKDAQTSFINVSAWNGTADFIGKYFKKGAPILMQGSLRSNQYTAKDGSKRTSYDFVANTVSFASRPDNAGNGAANNAAPQQAPVQAAPAPAANPAPAQAAAQYSAPDEYADFGEIIDDGDLPF